MPQILDNTGGGFNHVVVFTLKIGELIEFDEHTFSDACLNHQLEEVLINLSIIFSISKNSHPRQPELSIWEE